MVPARRILIVTTEMIPGCGAPTAGGGVRAWSLGKALEHAGHEVVFAIHEKALQGLSLGAPVSEFAFHENNLDAKVAQAGADVLLFEQWWPLSLLKQSEIPVVVDLPGPLILENHFRRVGDVLVNASTKIRALQKADFFLYATERQRSYFLPWLVLAGVDPTDVPMGLVPVCLSPELPEAQQDYRPNPAAEIRFIQGGIFWPWQDSSGFLNRILSVLDRNQSGRVQIFGGQHPHHQIKGEKYLDPAERLTPGARWDVLPIRPAEDLFADYARGGVAVDLMARNVERELSSAIRNVSYLWCGLPLICFDYSYLASDILAYEAGWVLGSEGEGLEQLTQSILEQPDEVIRRGECAQQLVRDKYTWWNAASELLSFCEKPRIRAKGLTFAQSASAFIEKQGQLEGRIRSMERESARREWILAKRDADIAKLHEKVGECESRASAAERDLHAIRSTFIFKFYKRIMRVFGGQ